MVAALRRWLLIFRIPCALFGVFLFFAVYNRFILNTNLQNLKTSLSILDAATGVGQAEAALLLVDQNLVDEMAKENSSEQSVVVLQYAQGVLASTQKQRPAVDAEVLMAILTDDAVENRSGLLKTMDRFVVGAQNGWRKITLVPRQAFSRTTSSQMDMAQLQEAVRLERLGALKEAAEIYEGLLSSYPKYSGRGLLKLRLGYVYQRSHNVGRAKRLFQEGMRESKEITNVEVAQQMLKALDDIRAKEGRAKKLQQRLAALPAGSERQQVAFELGSLFIQLYAFDKAAGFFFLGAVGHPPGGGVPEKYRQNRRSVRKIPADHPRISKESLGLYGLPPDGGSLQGHRGLRRRGFRL